MTQDKEGEEAIRFRTGQVVHARVLAAAHIKNAQRNHQLGSKNHFPLPGVP